MIPTTLHRALVPTQITEIGASPYGGWVSSLSWFYRAKRIAMPEVGLFSCNAAGAFPGGWHAAFESGIWNEPGEYGDNFRKFFGLSKG